MVHACRHVGCVGAFLYPPRETKTYGGIGQALHILHNPTRSRPRCSERGRGNDRPQGRRGEPMVEPLVSLLIQLGRRGATLAMDGGRDTAAWWRTEL